MNQVKLFIELTRLKKPIGYMLLFWPCIWGLTLVYDFNSSWNDYFFFSSLFLAGSILMRSAGCIVNDIVDKNIDIKVNRTKKRPIASGAISIKQSLFYVVVLCFIAFLILIQFNTLTIILGMSSMSLAFSYPYMKRFTYWPQLFLGLTFNWGLIMAWVAMTNFISIDIIILYIAAIFWTLGYDTIYGLQDIKDEEFSEVTENNFVLSDLGVALEHPNGSRMVIFGDADWISETASRFNNNVLLALNVIDWLAQEDNLASVRSKVVSERNLVFSSDTHRNIVQYTNIGGVPLAFIILGLVRFLQRRSKGFRNKWVVASNKGDENIAGPEDIK